MSDFLKQVLAFLIVLGPLVLVHELGHFIFAKRTGIRVQEFGIGFPPRARKLWRGMGRIRIGAEWVRTPRNFKYPSGLADGVVVEARAAETRGGLRLASIQIVDADQAGVVATPLKEMADGGVRLRGEVAYFDPGTDYSLNWLPIGGFVRMLGEEDPTAPDSFAAAPKRHRAAVLLAGPGMNIVAALLLFTLAFTFGEPVPNLDDIDIVITAVSPDSPAEQAGLQPGMVIVSADGMPVQAIDTLKKYTDAHPGKEIELIVLDADGAQRAVRVLARANPPDGQGRMGIVLDGRANSFHVEYASLPQAFSAALEATGDTLNGMITIPSRLLAGEISPEQARPVGPAGIAQIASYAWEASLRDGLPFQLLFLAGAISVALAVTNLLPLPALDGGRLVFVLIEAVRGRRVSPEREAVVHFAGMMFLLALFVLITIQDLSNPIPNIFR